MTYIKFQWMVEMKKKYSQKCKKAQYIKLRPVKRPAFSFRPHRNWSRGCHEGKNPLLRYSIAVSFLSLDESESLLALQRVRDSFTVKGLKSLRIASLPAGG